ncbi:MAG: sulfite exporter TauE/SafE family protein [bacterium]
MVALLAMSTAVGVAGALTGLGGGVLLVPLLTLGFGLDIRTAAGTSLLCLIGTRVGVGQALRGTGLVDERVGVVLGLAGLCGAWLGAEVAGWIPRRILYLLFGGIMGGIVLAMLARPPQPDLAMPQGSHRSSVRRAAGVASMAAAGLISGLLGIGGGALNVAVMHLILHLPLPNAAATSSFLHGVNALAGLPVYWARGDIAPLQAAPAVLGVVWGSTWGGRLLTRVPSRVVRAAFLPLVAWVAVQMFRRGLEMGG